MKIIARIRSDFPEKFGIPRQSGLIEELKARIVFEPEYRNPDALRGLEGYSASVADLAVLGSYSGELVSYGASAAPGRKSESWCFCNALSISAEPDRFVIGEDSFD